MTAAQRPASTGDVAIIAGAFGPVLFSIEKVECDKAGVAVAYQLKPLGAAFDPSQRVDASRVSAVLANLNPRSTR